MNLNPYRIMWLVVLFDLPTREKEERRAYQRFHKFLLKDGFMRMQYSVYIRPCASPENAMVHNKRIEGAVPPEGEVRVMQLTDKQFSRMQVFTGRMQQAPEPGVQQLELF